MKRSNSTMTRRFEGLSIFAGNGDNPETSFDLMALAQEEIGELKLAFYHKAVVFEYNGETITGRFVTAIEGEYPGTLMIVARIASSRLCSGPCFVHLRGERVGGIVVTGSERLVGITVKVRVEKYAGVISFRETVAAIAA